MSNFDSYDPSSSENPTGALVFDMEAPMEELSVEEELLPPGDYQAEIPEWNPSWIRLGISRKTNKPYGILDVPFRVRVPEELQNLGYPEFKIVRYTIFLDVLMSPDGRVTLNMKKGQNVNLGKFRQTLGINSAQYTIDAMGGRGPLTVEVYDNQTEKDQDGGILHKSKIRRIRSY